MHMPCEITQCYLPPGRGDFPAFTLAEAGTRFDDPGGCKAELTWVVVISHDSLPAKYAHLSHLSHHYTTEPPMYMYIDCHEMV